MRIAIYGTGKFACKLLSCLKNSTREYEIVYFVESEKRSAIFHGVDVKCALDIDPDEFDYLVIAVYTYKEIIKYLKVQYERYEDIEAKIILMRHFVFMMTDTLDEVMPYQSVSLPCGIDYISASSDLAIGKCMFDTDVNYAEKQIDVFFELADMYYKDNRNNPAQEYCFFDIGANIGTTSIYIRRKVDPRLKIVGIEASEQNYRLFRANCVLNGIDDIDIYHMGLGMKKGTGSIRYEKFNPGATHVDANCIEGEIIEISTLDDFLIEQGIDPETIAYLWMDTEGYEADIIIGAKGLIRNNRIPLMQEFNPKAYISTGVFDEYISVLKTAYNFFIDVEEYIGGNIKIRNISELYDYAQCVINSTGEQSDLFFF